jgi:L-ascorbate metabolism protein UlaG (beta-lactamase superfamily)
MIFRQGEPGVPPDFFVIHSFSKSEIQLIYYGHSCFEIDFAGKRIIIELKTARGIVNQLSPSVVIPMHYKTDRSHNDAKAEDLYEFIKMFDNVKKHDGSMIRIHEDDLNAEPNLLLMEYKEKGLTSS